MKNLFEPVVVEEVKARLAQLRPDSERLWGKMNAGQAVAHCAAGMEWAVGDKTPPRMFVGRILGSIVKPMALKDDEPMRRNSPTSKDLIVQDDREFGSRTGAAAWLMDRFAAAGPAGVYEASA